MTRICTHFVDPVDIHLHIDTNYTLCCKPASDRIESRYQDHCPCSWSEHTTLFHTLLSIGIVLYIDTSCLNTFDWHPDSRSQFYMSFHNCRERQNTSFHCYNLPRSHLYNNNLHYDKLCSYRMSGNHSTPCKQYYFPYDRVGDITDAQPMRPDDMLCTVKLKQYWVKKIIANISVCLPQKWNKQTTKKNAIAPKRLCEY